MIKRSVICVATFLLVSPIFLSAVPANTVVATMNVGVTPAGMAITPNNNFAYVANNNNYEITGQDSVSVLDLTDNTVVTTIHHASFDAPYTVAINPAGTKAYVTNSNSTTITIIDIATNTVTDTISGFDGPSDMVISLDGTTGYVNNYGSGNPDASGSGTTIQVVDLVNNLITGAPITVDQAPVALAMTSDGAFVYVINYVDGVASHGSMQIIQTSDNTVLPTTISGFFGPFAIALTPDDKFAYVTNFGSNNFAPFGTTVSVVDLTIHAITATINLGIQPSGIAITPDGNFAYASNYNTLYAGPSFTDLTAGQGTVNIIDIATNTVISPIIAVGQSPDSVVISPNGQFAYVTNYTSNTVDVIALQTFQIVAQGLQIQNRYLNQIELVNKLTWTVSGTSLPISYSIFRDAGLTDLAGTVLSSEPFVFLDYNRQPNINYTYYIVGTNQVGTTSAPVEVVM